MPRQHRRRHAIVRAVIVASAISAMPSSGSSVPLPPSDEEQVRRLVHDLTGMDRATPRLPLASDSEHARTIDPVLTNGTAIWIHESLPAGPMTVMRGRVFTYSDASYNPLEAPVLKIRPIDDDQTIPFLLRVIVKPDGRVSPKSAVTVSFPAPPIFNPSVTIIDAQVDSMPAENAVQVIPAPASITVRIPLSETVAENGLISESLITVIIAGELSLGEYKVVPPGRFASEANLELDPQTAELASLDSDRNFDRESEWGALHKTAELMRMQSSSTYDSVRRINAWVGNHLQYQEGPVTRSPVEALEDRAGDCDEHAALMVALLRAVGIPARLASGLLYDFNTLALHSWVEAAIPKRDHQLHWFMCDPTLAGTTPLDKHKARYVQIRDRVFLFPMRPTVSLEGFTGSRTSDVLIHWRRTESIATPDITDLNRFVDLVTQEVDREISRGATRLAKADLMFRRKSAFVPGSPYLIVDRPIAERSLSHLQLRLENEERLVLEMSAQAGGALESDSDQEFVSRFRKAHDELSSMFFAGAPAHANLELVFSRDRHTDKLESVSLRFARFLIENYLDHIIDRLRKRDLVTSDEATHIKRVSEISGRANLYILQELARKRSATD